MQTLYLVLHEKHTFSDLRGSVMMPVIFLQMTLNKCQKKKNDKMDNLHNWPTDRTLNKRNSTSLTWLIYLSDLSSLGQCKLFI